MSALDRLYRISPMPELFMRWGYYKVFKPLFRNGYRHTPKTEGVINQSVISHVKLDDLLDKIRDFGVQKGDLVIIHSSAKGLSDLECNPNDLLDALIAMVGPDGTIAMPAFPDEERLKEQDGIKIYDPQRSVAWTGMMPNLLLRKKGAVRSCFPYNPLVSIGPKAADMMKDNINVEYAHGDSSCWGYCLQNHAKILYLGLPAFHSFTILHTIEDFNFGHWLPNEWFEEKQYYVIIEGEIVPKTIKIRAHRWSQYLAEKHTEQKYIAAGLVKTGLIGNIELRYIDDSYNFIDYIISNWDKMNCYYLPKKYKKL